MYSTGLICYYIQYRIVYYCTLQYTTVQYSTWSNTFGLVIHVSFLLSLNEWLPTENPQASSLCSCRIFNLIVWSFTVTVPVCSSIRSIIVRFSRRGCSDLWKFQLSKILLNKGRIYDKNQESFNHPTYNWIHGICYTQSLFQHVITGFLSVETTFEISCYFFKFFLLFYK